MIEFLILSAFALGIMVGIVLLAMIQTLRHYYVGKFMKGNLTVKKLPEIEPPHQIYMTRTGRAYHLSPTCSRSEPGTTVSLKPCMRCFKAMLKEL